MPQAVFNADWVGRQPFLDDRGVHIIIIRPALIAGVVRRVNEDAVDLPGMGRQQRLERVQIVPVDDQIAIQRDRADPLRGVRHERPERHRKMMIVDEFLALEIQFGHVAPAGKI